MTHMPPLPHILGNHHLSMQEQITLYYIWYYGGKTKTELCDLTKKSRATLTRYLSKLMEDGYIVAIPGYYSESVTEGTKMGRPFNTYIPVEAVIIEEFDWPKPESSDDLGDAAGPAVHTTNELVYIDWQGERLPLSAIIRKMLEVGPYIGTMIKQTGFMFLHLQLNDKRAYIDQMPNATGYPDGRVELYAYLMTIIEVFKEFVGTLEELSLLDMWRGLPEIGGGQFEKPIENNNYLPRLHGVAKNTINHKNPAWVALQARLKSQGLEWDEVDGKPDIIQHFGYTMSETVTEEQHLMASKAFSEFFNQTRGDKRYQEMLRYLRMNLGVDAAMQLFTEDSENVEEDEAEPPDEPTDIDL